MHETVFEKDKRASPISYGRNSSQGTVTEGQSNCSPFLSCQLFAKNFSSSPEKIDSEIPRLHTFHLFGS